MKKTIEIDNVRRLYVRYVYNRYVGATRNEDLLYWLFELSSHGMVENVRQHTKYLMEKMDISHTHLRQLLMQLEQLGVIKKYMGNILLDPLLFEKDDKVDTVEIVQRKPKDKHKDAMVDASVER